MNGAAPASPPSASIANAGAQAPTTFSRLSVLVMFYSCLARMSSPPTPTSSSGSPVDVARERAPIASPGSLPNTLGDPDDGAPRPSGRDSAIWDARHPGVPRCGAYFVDLGFPPRPQTGQQKGCGASASSKTAAPDGAPLRRRLTPKALT